MSDELTAFYSEWRANRRAMREQTPAITNGFGGFFQAVMKDGALSKREKELISVAIALSVRCEPCIHLHVKSCLEAGATREQVLEAAAVAVVMQGGPTFTLVPEVIKALDHLEAK